MTNALSFFFPFRLAWRQLGHDRVRFATAISGVVFACFLVFMQDGFKDALFDSATLLQKSMTGEIYVLHEQSEGLWRTAPFPRQRLYQTLSLPEVESVTPLYVAQGPWKNPVTGISRTVLVLGIEPRADVYPLKGLEEIRPYLFMRDVVLMDEFSRPEFGPIKEMLQTRKSVPVEVSGSRMNVMGTFQMGITFSADGNVITNDVTFFKMFPLRSQHGVDIGVVSLKKGADPDLVKKKLVEILPQDVEIFTKPEYIKDEEDYWDNLTPIGYIFNFGTIMGLIIGFVIVYQVLFNDISSHLHEYATLKAMGYDNLFFVKVVLSSSLILALLGFIPGWLISLLFYYIVEKGIFIVMNLTTWDFSLVFSLILGMCLLSALFAVRKLRSSSPVDVFA